LTTSSRIVYSRFRTFTAGEPTQCIHLIPSTIRRPAASSSAESPPPPASTLVRSLPGNQEGFTSSQLSGSGLLARSNSRLPLTHPGASTATGWLGPVRSDIRIYALRRGPRSVVAGLLPGFIMAEVSGFTTTQQKLGNPREVRLGERIL